MDSVGTDNLKEKKAIKTREKFKFFDAQHLINIDCIRMEGNKLPIAMMHDLRSLNNGKLPAVFSEALASLSIIGMARSRMIEGDPFQNMTIKELKKAASSFKEYLSEMQDTSNNNAIITNQKWNLYCTPFAD